MVLKHELTEEQKSNVQTMAEAFLLTVTFGPKQLVLKGIKQKADKAQIEIYKFLQDTKPQDAVEYPPEWQDQQTNLQLFTITSGPEYAHIEREMKHTLSSCKILKVERVQNKWLWEKYFSARYFLDKKNGHKNNEKLLFHGTRTTPPQLVYNGQEGFDYKFSDGGLWGRGTYFATSAVYSHAYATQLPDGTRQILLAKVLVGDSILVPQDSTIKMAPAKPSKSGAPMGFQQEYYDSITDRKSVV